MLSRLSKPMIDNLDFFISRPDNRQDYREEQRIYGGGNILQEDVQMKKSVFTLFMALFFCFFVILPVQAEGNVSAQIKEYFAAALDAHETEKNDAVIQNCNKLIELDPNNVSFRLMRADGYYKLKNYELAFQDLDTVLLLNPKNELALYNKACVFSLQNKQSEALQLLRQLCYMDGSWKEPVSQDKDFDVIKNTAAFQALTGIDVFINGKVLDSDCAPLLADGRTLVPLRAIFEALGAKVEWDAENRKINCATDKGKLMLQIDNRQAKMNDQEITLDTPAIIKQNRTYVPLRFVAESLGAVVNWQANSKQVHITAAANAPAEAVPDEEKIMAGLQEKLDFLAIDGAAVTPYNMKAKQGLAIFVVKSQEDLQAFQSLRDEHQKLLLNERVQAQWGNFIGCESVRIYLVFNGQRYVESATAYQKQSTTLTLIKFQPGIDTAVIVQDKDSFYYDYYGGKKSVFKFSETKEPGSNEKMVPYDIYFYDVYFCSIEYPETWKIDEDEDMVFFYSPEEGENDEYQENINIDISEIPKEMMEKLQNPDAFIAFAKHKIEEYFFDEISFETAKLDEKTEFGNGYIFIYTSSYDGMEVKGISYVFLSNESVIAYFELTAEKKNYEKYLQIFNAMEESVHYANPDKSKLL